MYIHRRGLVAGDSDSGDMAILKKNDWIFV
jgi:hypothetical protein